MVSTSFLQVERSGDGNAGPMRRHRHAAAMTTTPVEPRTLPLRALVLLGALTAARRWSPTSTCPRSRTWRVRSAPTRPRPSSPSRSRWSAWRSASSWPDRSAIASAVCCPSGSACCCSRSPRSCARSPTTSARCSRSGSPRTRGRGHPGGRARRRTRCVRRRTRGADLLRADARDGPGSRSVRWSAASSCGSPTGGDLRGARHSQRAAAGGHVAGAGGDRQRRSAAQPEPASPSANRPVTLGRFLLISGCLGVVLFSYISMSCSCCADYGVRTGGVLLDLRCERRRDDRGRAGQRATRRSARASLMLQWVGLVLAAMASGLVLALVSRLRRSGAGPLWFVLCGLGLSFGNATALAMVPHGGVAGPRPPARHQPVPPAPRRRRCSRSAAPPGSRWVWPWASPPFSPSSSVVARRADARGLDSRRCPSRGRVRTPGGEPRLAPLEATLRLAGERGYVGTTMARSP